MRLWECVICLAMGGIVLLFIGAYLLLKTIPEQRPQRVKAQVVSLHNVWGRCFQQTAIVLRTEAGRQGQDWRPTAVLGCREGDWVEAEQVGVTLRLAGASCLNPDATVGSRGC